jgi:WD40 repeat protein
VWDLNNGDKPLKTLKGHTGFVNSVAITSDNTKIVSGSGDTTVKVWDLNNGVKPLKTLKGHSGFVTSVAITSDNTKIVSGSWDTTVKVWEQTNSSNIVICKFDSFVSTISLSNDNRNMVIGDEIGNIYLMEITSYLK